MKSIFLRLKKSYHSFFELSEIERSSVLQLSFWSLLLVFVIDLVPKSTYIEGAQRLNKTNWHYTCWPHFQNCDQFFFLDNLPQGASYSALMMMTFGVIMLALVAGVQKRWELAHFCLLFLFIYKFLYNFVFNYGWGSNFEYYHLPFVFVFLFAKNKETFLKLIFLVLYSIAALVKMNDGWIEGFYFSATSHGLPLINRELIPVATNAVIIFEIFFSWGLVSSNHIYQRISFWFWIFFHAYSVTLVGLFYPLICTPLLVILFGKSQSKLALPSFRKSPLGHVLIISLLTINLAPKFLPHDTRYTGEIHQYTLAMIDANFQCESLWTVYDKQEKIIDQSFRSSSNATQRCPPYAVWFRLKKRCERDSNASRISMIHDISVNGGPFYRVVDQDNVCNLSFKAFSRNRWIRTPQDGAKIVGYPRPNALRHPAYFPDSRRISYKTPTQSRTNWFSNLGYGVILQKVYWAVWWLFNLAMSCRLILFSINLAKVDRKVRVQ